MSAKMSYRTPYDVFESIHGAYDFDVIPAVPFSVWMSEEKSAYLLEHPEAARNQIDGHFYGVELERFFRWISERPRVVLTEPSATDWKAIRRTK